MIFSSSRCDLRQFLEYSMLQSYRGMIYCAITFYPWGEHKPSLNARANGRRLPTKTSSHPLPSHATRHARFASTQERAHSISVSYDPSAAEVYFYFYNIYFGRCLVRSFKYILRSIHSGGSLGCSVLACDPFVDTLSKKRCKEMPS